MLRDIVVVAGIVLGAITREGRIAVMPGGGVTENTAAEIVRGLPSPSSTSPVVHASPLVSLSQSASPRSSRLPGTLRAPQTAKDFNWR
jgi:copper homeostasis protein CutC